MRFVRVRPETKFAISSQTDIAVNNNGSQVTVLTNSTGEGPANNEYIGTMISPKLIQLNVCFRLDTEGGSACVRWYVVQWLADNSLDPFTVPKYLTSSNVNSHTNYVNRAKFRTLKKGSFALNRLVAVGDPDHRTTRPLNVVIRPRANVYFTDSGLGTLQKNHVFFFAISDVGLNPPLMSLINRHLYTDS